MAHNPFTIVPEDINIVDVILAVPSYPSEYVICNVIRGSSSNFAFYSGGGVHSVFRATVFPNGEVTVVHWRHAETIPMLVGVFYQS